MMAKETRQLESLIDDIEDVWDSIYPGARLVVSSPDGHHVSPAEDLQTVLATFNKEAEARAYSVASQHVERLAEELRCVLKERDEAITALREIKFALEEKSHSEDDEAKRLHTIRKWANYVLESE
tara:strand:+ start:61714 stop:62088 length:375 start_codon:yes stop_codon:yes gene_type:complete